MFNPRSNPQGTMYGLNPNLPFPTQYLPSLFNPQDQTSSYNIITNQSHALSSYSFYNSIPPQPFQTLESTPFPYQTAPIPWGSYPTPPPCPPLNPTNSFDRTFMAEAGIFPNSMSSNSQFDQEMAPFYNQGAPVISSSNPTMIAPDHTSMQTQQMEEIDYENCMYQNNNMSDFVYQGNFGRMDNDPNYYTSTRLPTTLAPYLEVTGCWTDLQVTQKSVPKRLGRKKKSWGSSYTIISYPKLPLLPPVTKVLTFVLKKELKNSDVNHLNRIILPKNEAQMRLPSLIAKTGLVISVRDALSPEAWIMRYRFWFNNESQIFVLENTGDFVDKYELKSGDFMALYEDAEKQLYIIGQRTIDPFDSFNEVARDALTPEGIISNNTNSEIGFPPLITIDAENPTQEEEFNSIDAPSDSNEFDWLSILDFSEFDDFEPEVFDENGLSIVDMRPGNQDDCIILKKL